VTELYRRFDGYDELKPLLDASDEEVLVRLARPTLVRIPGTGRGRPARAVACLLHGNEDSGYRAVLDLLRGGVRYPFDLWVLIGNVRAASHEGWFAHRYLDDQEDFNRVWGLEEPTTRMRRCAEAVLAELAGADLEAAVDLHNNTGEHPPYAIVPTPTSGMLRLAAACTDCVLLWHLRAHTLMEALSPLCPAIAIECGPAGRDASAHYARAALDRFLTAERVDDGHAPSRVYEMLQRVEVRPEVAFTFGGRLTDELDLVLAIGLDGQNLGMLFAGSEVGRGHPGAAMPLRATDMRGREVTADCFRADGHGRLVLTQDVTPVMMTTTAQQARRDCLFYVARRRG
jgi:hypothetical protein